MKKLATEMDDYWATKPDEAVEEKEPEAEKAAEEKNAE